MDDSNRTSNRCFSKDVTENGKTVTVYVSLINDCEWELSLIGKANQSTCWLEWFPTSEDATNAGLTAILREGIDECYSDPEFSYLDER